MRTPNRGEAISKKGGEGEASPWFALRCSPPSRAGARRPATPRHLLFYPRKASLSESAPACLGIKKSESLSRFAPCEIRWRLCGYLLNFLFLVNIRPKKYFLGHEKLLLILYAADRVCIIGHVNTNRTMSITIANHKYIISSGTISLSKICHPKICRFSFTPELILRIFTCR